MLVTLHRLEKFRQGLVDLVNVFSRENFTVAFDITNSFGGYASFSSYFDRDELRQ